MHLHNKRGGDNYHRIVSLHIILYQCQGGSVGRGSGYHAVGRSSPGCVRFTKRFLQVFNSKIAASIRLRPKIEGMCSIGDF